LGGIDPKSIADTFDVINALRRFRAPCYLSRKRMVSPLLQS